MNDPMKEFEARLKIDAFINTSAPDYETCFEQAKSKAIEDHMAVLPYLENMSIEDFTEANPRIKGFYATQGAGK